MNKLLNSAMMPSLDFSYLQIPGRVSPEEFAQTLQSEPFESYIGYPETARILEELSGLKIPISRAQTTIGLGDKLLFARLKYRMPDPGQKGKTEHTIDDFEFAIYKVVSYIPIR